MLRYKSNGKVITKSKSHESMFIVNYSDGGWCSVNTDLTTITKSNKPDKGQEFLVKEYQQAKF